MSSADYQDHTESDVMQNTLTHHSGPDAAWIGLGSVGQGAASGSQPVPARFSVHDPDTHLARSNPSSSNLGQEAGSHDSFPGMQLQNQIHASELMASMLGMRIEPSILEFANQVRRASVTVELTCIC